ncbi:MAG: hypothetical protein R6V10_12420 [bacterium]
MSERELTGKCYLCGRSFKKSGMTRHLKSCLAARSDQGSAAGDKGFRGERFMHISIQGWRDDIYWMHVEISTEALLYDLDRFLRDIWLECCGHLSVFTILRTRYSVDPLAELDEEDMEVKMGEVLAPGMKFFHEYDFGTPTLLELKVISERVAPAGSESLRLLARNDPPDIECDVCGKPATQVCVACVYDEAGWLCDDCARNHECGEDMLLPVVNSPRTGECGYCGPSV